MKLNQVFNPLFLVIAVLSLVLYAGWGTKFIAAGSQEGSTSTTATAEKLSNQDAKESEAEESEIEKASEADLAETKALLQKSVSLLRGKSIQSKIRQRAMLFDTEVISNGIYLQADGGKGGTKIELEVQTQHLELSIRMINDGVYFFRQVRQLNESVSDEANDLQAKSVPTVERINLRQIREEYTGAVAWPGHWISFGGLYLFMDQARRSFAFGPVRQKEIKNVTYDVVTGVWKPEVLAKLVPSQKENILDRHSINWQKIPQHIPLEVDIYFVQKGPLAGFPLRIVFFRPTDELLEGIKKTPVLITEYSDPIEIDTPLQSDFQFNANKNEVSDVTDAFLSSLRR